MKSKYSQSYVYLIDLHVICIYKVRIQGNILVCTTFTLNDV